MRGPLSMPTDSSCELSSHPERIPTIFIIAEKQVHTFNFILIFPNHKHVKTNLLLSMLWSNKIDLSKLEA